MTVSGLPPCSLRDYIGLESLLFLRELGSPVLPTRTAVHQSRRERSWMPGGGELYERSAKRAFDGESMTLDAAPPSLQPQKLLGVLPEDLPLNFLAVVGVLLELLQPHLRFQHRVVGPEHHLVFQDRSGVVEHLVVDVFG